MSFSVRISLLETSRVIGASLSFFSKVSFLASSLSSCIIFGFSESNFS